MTGGEAPGAGDRINLATLGLAPVHVPAGYAPAYGAPVYVCLRCGSAVTYVDVHDEWHDRMFRASGGAF